MELDAIRKEFVMFMEEIHSDIGYPKNFFGVLSAIIIEEEPVTQERIQVLTGYSKATVSLALQKIQLHVPAKRVKKSGERKHYYQYEGEASGILAALWQERVDTPDLDLSLIANMLDKKELQNPEDNALLSFKKYLMSLKDHLEMMYKLRENYTSRFFEGIFSEGLKETDFPSLKQKEQKEIDEFQKKMDCPEIECNNDVLKKKKRNSTYLDLKREYIHGIGTSIHPFFARRTGNTVSVVHDIFIEGCTTQKEIQETTGFSRSVVSEILIEFTEKGFIEEKRYHGNLQKFYTPRITIPQLILGYYDRGVAYAQFILSRLSALITKVPNTEDGRQLRQKLKSFNDMYEITNKFFLRMKADMTKEMIRYQRRAHS